MLKRTLALLLFCASIGILTGCGFEHKWVEATCIAPKTCSKCNKTEGVALEHTWQEATCEGSKLCVVCHYIASDP